MYRACIFCSAGLGRNDVVEVFPVGKTLAFDGRKGRLWAVCPGCARWNLAPFEERWEALEAAERLFAGCRLRARAENIGIAKLPDGTRLVRVGQAPPVELAAWRYGESLRGRRRQALLATWGGAAGAVVAGAAGGALVFALLPAAVIGAGWGLMLSSTAAEVRRTRPLARLSAQESPTGRAVTLHRRLVTGAALVPGEGAGEVALHLPGWPAPLSDAVTRRVPGRAMVRINAAGGGTGAVRRALDVLRAAPSAAAFVRGVAEERPRLEMSPFLEPSRLPPGEDGWLALEMALHEETERRALEGELSLLEAAWREAEEIAGIADRLAAPGPAAREE